MKHSRAPTNWRPFEIAFVAIEITCVVVAMIIIALLLASSFRVHAAGNPGDLDPSFGNGGKVITDFSGAGWAFDVAVQPDGKVVVAGGGGDFALARYNPDGTLDSTFGAGGKVTTYIPGYNEPRHVGILPDGRIVVLGPAAVGYGGTAAIVCYHPDGSVDTSFGNGGQIIGEWTPAVGESFPTNDMVIQPDGRIILFGNWGTTSLPFARLNPDGSFDGSFGTNGRATVTVPNFYAFGTAVTVQSDGRIVGVGYSYDPNLPGSSQFTVVRLTGDGSLDPTFGSGGTVRTDFVADKEERASRVLIGPNGRILVAGFAGSYVSSDLALVRYKPDGSLDTSFGIGGKVTTDIAEKDYARDIVLQPDGRIVVAKSPSFQLVRYNSDGQLDSTFGNGGVVSTNFSTDVQIQSEVQGLVYVGNDRLIAVGGRIDPTHGWMMSGFVLASYFANSTPTPAMMQFGQSSYSKECACTSLTVTVKRSGKTSGTDTVDYASADGTAREGRDYVYAVGRVTFAPGETEKTISVLLNDMNDSAVSGTIAFSLGLSNPSSGAALGNPSTTAIQITHDFPHRASNPIDEPSIFICQQYHDFLNRQPEAEGLQFYLDILNGCNPSDAECLTYTRGALSANFFRSPEFGGKGIYVANLYNVTLGQRPKIVTELSDATKVERPRYTEFFIDLASISAPNDDPNQLKDQLAVNFLQRTDVQHNIGLDMNPDMTAQQFVQRLEAIAGLTLANESTLINSGMTHAQLLRAVAESSEVANKFYIQNFVTMEYLGYLRRDPEDCRQSPDPTNCGFIFQNRRFSELLPQIGSDLTQNFLVRGFIESPEYRQRFGQN